MLLSSQIKNIATGFIQPFKRQPHKMVEHTQTIRKQFVDECLSVFYHFVGSTFKGLSCIDLTKSHYSKRNTK